MFAHAIRSTHTTAPNSSSRFLRTDWTTTSCSRSNRSDQLALLSGYAVAHSRGLLAQLGGRGFFGDAVVQAAKRPTSFAQLRCRS